MFEFTIMVLADWVLGSVAYLGPAEMWLGGAEEAVNTLVSDNWEKTNKVGNSQSSTSLKHHSIFQIIEALPYILIPVFCIPVFQMASPSSLKQQPS